VVARRGSARAHVEIDEISVGRDCTVLLTIEPEHLSPVFGAPPDHIEVTGNGELTIVPYKLDKKEYRRRLAIVNGTIVDGEVVTKR